MLHRYLSKMGNLFFLADLLRHPVSPAGGGIKGGGWKMLFIIRKLSSPCHSAWPKRPPPEGDSVTPSYLSKMGS